MRFLSQEEIKKLVKASTPRLYPVLACALMTGMRRGEILGLIWANVDMERGIIHVLKSKSGRQRHIEIASQLKSILDKLPRGGSEPIFKMSEDELRRQFRRACKKAEITGFRFHDLRHTFASHVLMKTNDLASLQYLLGHSTLEMTMRYAHLSNGHVRSCIAALDSSMTIPGRQELPGLMNNVEKSILIESPSTENYAYCGA